MLTLQVGQCGNQLGRAFFSALARDDERVTGDATDASGSAFFRAFDPCARGALNRPVARAVLVDMEPKVVAQCISGNATTSSAHAAFAYDPRNVLTQQSGSGNNWALGYAGHGARLADALEDLLQREVEQCDAVRGVLTLQSVAGGTGSGLGSYLTEHVLRDAFPSALLLNAVVWPYASGEVIVQNYNALLTIASLTRAADGVVVLPNDTAHAECQRLLRLPRPSFDDLNGVLATRLAAALLPVGDSANEPMMEMGRQLCSHAGYKLLDIKTIPQMPPRSKQFTTHTWTGLLKHLHQMQIANAPLEEGIDWHIKLDTAHGRAYNRALASMLVLRGSGQDTDATVDVTAFRDPAMYASWSLEPFTWFTSPRRFNAYDKSATLISNSKALLPTLVSTVDKAYEMFSQGAYTHQYARHGVDDAFFQEAFLQVDQVVRNYQTL